MRRARIVIKRAYEAAVGRWPFMLALAAMVFIPIGLLETIDGPDAGIDGAEATDLELVALIAATALHLASEALGAVLYAGAVATALISTPRGRNPSLRRIVRETRWGPLIAIDLLFAVGLLVSAMLLIVPFFFFFARYVLASVLAEVEGRGVRGSFHRSAELSRGSRRLVLGVLLTAAAVGGLGSEIAQGAATMLGADGFLGAWLSAAAVNVLYSPVVAVLTVALAVELGAGATGSPHGGPTGTAQHQPEAVT